MERVCQECSDVLLGRIDQKFCSDQCRNTFNNRLNRDETGYMKNLSRVLRKNRRILKELNPDGSSGASKMKLLSKGFNFMYFTHICETSEGNVCFFCFDYGYLPVENDYFAIIKNNATKL